MLPLTLLPPVFFYISDAILHNAGQQQSWQQDWVTATHTARKHNATCQKSFLKPLSETTSIKACHEQNPNPQPFPGRALKHTPLCSLRPANLLGSPGRGCPPRAPCPRRPSGAQSAGSGSGEERVSRRPGWPASPSACHPAGGVNGKQTGSESTMKHRKATKKLTWGALIVTTGAFLLIIFYRSVDKIN